MSEPSGLISAAMVARSKWRTGSRERVEEQKESRRVLPKSLRILPVPYGNHPSRCGKRELQSQRLLHDRNRNEVVGVVMKLKKGRTDLGRGRAISALA